MQLPVEVCFAGRSTIISLRDISRGGMCLEQVPADWLAAMQREGAAVSLEILGLDADPLGIEMASHDARQTIAACPVHIVPGIGLGARFLESHPPV